jgi:hypothetical protein
MIKKHPRRPTTPWMFGPLLDLLPPTFEETCPLLDALGHACSLFLSLADPKGESKNAHPPLDLEDEWKLMCSSDSSLGSKTFSFHLFFLEAIRVFAKRPTLPFSPFFRVTGEGVFMGRHFARAHLILPFCITTTKCGCNSLVPVY